MRSNHAQNCVGVTCFGPVLTHLTGAVARSMRCESVRSVAAVAAAAAAAR